MLLTGSVPFGKSLKSFGFSFLMCEVGFLDVKGPGRRAAALQMKLIGRKKKIELRFYLKILSERLPPPRAMD